MFTTQSVLAVPSDIVDLRVNGVSVSALGFPLSVEEGVAETITFPEPVAGAFLPNVTVALTEGSSLVLSDLLTTSAPDPTTGLITFTLTSDPEIGQPTLPSDTPACSPTAVTNCFIPETGALQEVTPLFLSATAIGAGAQLFVASDPDVTPPPPGIPEPTTAALFTLGLGVLWVVDRKRRRS